MTKRFKATASARYVSGAALTVSLAALTGAAFAVPGYVTQGTSSEAPLTSGSGLCWRTGDWSPDKAKDPCDPVPRAAAPIAPVVRAPEPAPAPVAPIAAAPLAAPPVIERVTLNTDVLFEFNKAELLPGGQKKLDDLASTAQKAEVDRVVIVGHADRIGSDDYNKELSERRAMAVKDYLAQKGAPADRVEAQGRGESEPLAQCGKMGKEVGANKKLVSCLQPDRRVEIEVLGHREVAGGAASPSSSGASTPSGSAGSSTGAAGSSSGR
jgi:OOP family OmpA-OmpF porin